MEIAEHEQRDDEDVDVDNDRPNSVDRSVEGQLLRHTVGGQIRPCRAPVRSVEDDNQDDVRKIYEPAEDDSGPYHDAHGPIHGKELEVQGEDGHLQQELSRP